MFRVSNNNLKEKLLNTCVGIAASHDTQANAICLYGPRVCGYAYEKNDIDLLLVLRRFRKGLTSHRKSIDDNAKALILTVDSGAFQRDVKQGWLGEFVAEKILVPYEPLFNKEYLWRQEVLLKKRIVWELLENIVLGFPESSHEVIIKPEYFLHQTIMQRSKLFPPVTFRFLNMLRNDVKERNIKRMMQGFSQALKELTEEKWINFSENHVKITPKFIHTIKARKLRIPSFLRSIHRAAFFHFFSAFPRMMSPLQREEEIFMQTHREFRSEELTLQLEDPEKYLLMPTPLGLVPMSDETTIEEFVRKNVPSGKVADIQIRELGGVLNTAYLLSFRRNHEEQKIVVKKFKDWVGFKWFPLAIWALGTKSFAVFGQSRLEREYSLSQFLHGQGWPVPRVLYISPKERLIFKEFVEGENLSSLIQRLLADMEKAYNKIALIKTVGRKIAEAHRLGVTLGDCKPENVIITEDGTPYFVDLEQASRDGNQAWDIAEFLYYAGHFVSPIATTEAAESIAKAFIEGYLEAGGKKETIRKVSSARYTKVFSIFTPPHVILAISNLCKGIGEEKQNLK
jgi:tRNA A-37 threonylcarbamoyl transferase component Bud32